MGIFDDGPYEVGDENSRDENLVPVPANSYLGRIKLFGGLQELLFEQRAITSISAGKVILLQTSLYLYTHVSWSVPSFYMDGLKV